MKRPIPYNKFLEKHFSPMALCFQWYIIKINNIPVDFIDFYTLVDDFYNKKNEYAVKIEEFANAAKDIKDFEDKVVHFIMQQRGEKINAFLIDGSDLDLVRCKDTNFCEDEEPLRAYGAEWVYNVRYDAVRHIFAKSRSFLKRAGIDGFVSWAGRDDSEKRYIEEVSDRVRREETQDVFKAIGGLMAMISACSAYMSIIIFIIIGLGIRDITVTEFGNLLVVVFGAIAFGEIGLSMTDAGRPY